MEQNVLDQWAAAARGCNSLEATQQGARVLVLIDQLAADELRSSKRITEVLKDCEKLGQENALQLEDLTVLQELHDQLRVEHEALGVDRDEISEKLTDAQTEIADLKSKLAGLGDADADGQLDPKPKKAKAAKE